MKKLLAVLMILMLAAGCAGCGKAADSPAATQAPPAAESPAAENPAAPEPSESSEAAGAPDTDADSGSPETAPAAVRLEDSGYALVRCGENAETEPVGIGVAVPLGVEECVGKRPDVSADHGEQEIEPVGTAVHGHVYGGSDSSDPKGIHPDGLHCLSGLPLVEAGEK